MTLLDLTLPDLAANLALDEALLLSAAEGGPEVLRFWEWPRPAVVIGAGGRWAHEVHVAACERDNVPVVRRASGGGAVLLGPGCLLFSLVLNYDRHPGLVDLHASYRLILETVSDALAPLVAGVTCAGISDLALAGLKFSGNSQQRKRTHLLHHGTLLCSFELAQVPRYVAHPPREPDYRCGRTHLDFMTNLQLPLEDVKQRLAAAWAAQEPLTVLPEGLLRSLAANKYGCLAWQRRR